MGLAMLAGAETQGPAELKTHPQDYSPAVTLPAGVAQGTETLKWGLLLHKAPS